MKLNRTGSNWNELERNKINENWDIIEGGYNDVVGQITDEVVGHLIDSAKLIWKEPVETEADLPEDAEVGETRMVRESDDGVSHVYRYNGEKWDLIQEIDVSLVNEVDRRLSASLSEITGKLAKISDEQAKKQAYEGSLVKLIKKESVLQNEVIVKVHNKFQVDVGVFHQANRATIYTFKPDGDGWWRLFDATVRPVKKTEILENYKKSVNLFDKTGSWTEATPTWYTTEIGATFSGEFEGTGFNFNHRADDRGGVWEFVIDGYITKEVSTYSPTLKDNVSSLVAKGLRNSKHSFVATFKGKDPNKSYSESARGWANFYIGTGITPKTITPYTYSFEDGPGIPVLQTTSRKEFAFSIRPAGSTSSARWVPEHGNLGAMKNVVTKILLDNVEITDLSNETTDHYRIYKDVKIITNYDAYYTEGDTPAWTGRIDQTINGQGYHNRHKMKFLADLEIVMGYPVMMAVSKTTTGNDYVVTSLGDRHYLNPSINDGTDVILEGEPVSVAHFSSSATPPLTDLVIAFEVFDYKRTMRVGKMGRPIVPTRVEMRTDGERKTYFGSFENHVVEAGETYDFGFSYFIGEIYNATEILP